MLLSNVKSTVTYNFDLLNRVTATSQTFPMGGARSVGYAYEADGFTSAITYPDGNIVHYTYTARGQMSGVTSGAPPPLALYSYDLDGRLVTRTLENGLTSGMGYDAASQLTGIAHVVGSSTLDTLGYTLDVKGRRTGINRSNGFNDGYSYDAAGQVTGGAYADTAAGTTQTDGFAYDGSGNRTRSTRNSTLTAYAPNAADQYASVGGTAQSYDAAGNQTLVKLPGGPGLALGYDAENRLLTEERNAGVVASDKAHVVNTYDALQRRIMKQAYIRNPANTAWVLGKTILFTYEGWNVIEEREFTGSAVTPAGVYYRYSWGADLSGTRQGAGGVGGLLMAEEVPASGSATAHFYAYDGNGNVTHVLDASGAIEASYRYSAFGGDMGTTASTTFAQRNPWRFSTKYLDKEVEKTEGFYYFGFRHYLTALGRWPSRDPIGERGGVNLYVYVKNKPISAFDLLGLDVVVIIGGGVSDNPAGHAAMALTGKGVYSFGTTHKDGIDLYDYLEDQTKKRCQVLYVIPTTPEEDEIMLDEFKKERAKGYGILKGDTCATAVCKGLKKIGVFHHATSFPAMLNQWFQLQLFRRSGITMYEIPQGADNVRDAALDGFSKK